jgi:hypothetical protein
MVRNGGLGGQTLVIGPPVGLQNGCDLVFATPWGGGVQPTYLQSLLQPHALNTEACLQWSPPQYPTPSRHPMAMVRIPLVRTVSTT